MNFETIQQNVRRSLRQKNYAYFISGALLISNVVLTIKVLTHEEKWVLIPQFATDQKIEVQGSQYSDAYLTQWAGSLARELLTVNPATVQKVSDKFLKISATKYGQIKPYLEAHAKEIRENDISTVFYEKDCKIDRDKSEIEITGTFCTYFGREKPPIIETKTFVVGWSLGINGVLLVSKFQEKKEI